MRDIRQEIVEHLLAHLNHRLSETELVHWAEDTWVFVSEADEDLPDEDLLLDVLGYLGAGDTRYFPLTWTTLSGFLQRLGVQVRVIAEPIS